MTSIYLSVGQCGNQLANCLLNYLDSNQSESSISYLFKFNDDKFRLIGLDGDNKVIAKMRDEHLSRVRKENLIAYKKLNGSLWASGYACLNRESENEDEVTDLGRTMEAIRKESERCDFLVYFNLLHSLAGGVGSGCTSRLMEKLRDEYGSKKYIFNHSIAPFRDGEVPLQHYNTLLTFPYLSDLSDCIYLHQNDDVMIQTEKYLNEVVYPNSGSVMKSGKNQLAPIRSTNGSRSAASANGSQQENEFVTFNDMNSYIIRNILTSQFPVDTVSLRSQSIGMESLELMRLLCSMPSMKIVELYNLNINESSSSSALNRYTSVKDKSKDQNLTMNILLKQTFGSIPKFNMVNEKPDHYTSLGSLLVARSNLDMYVTNGDSSSSNQQLAYLWSNYDLIKRNLNPVKWNPFSIEFWTSNKIVNEPVSVDQKKSSNLKSSSMTLCLNRNKCLDYLSEVYAKSAGKYKQKAYLHWYDEYGIGDDYFSNGFESLQRVIDSYKNI